MLNETFYIDGVDARNFGIYLQKPIEFSEAIPVIERQSIPGRNGDLIFDTGSYENRTGTASCFCLQKDVEKAISAAGRFLMGKKGYRRLETSDDPNHFWLARVENSPQIMQRMRTLAPFEITFDCKPQRFLKSGEEKIVLDFSGQSNRAVLYNQFGFASQPLLHIGWNSSESNYVGITFYYDELIDGVVSSKGININNFPGDNLYVDCDIHDVYNESGNLNRYVQTYEFPVLAPGRNQMLFLTEKGSGSYIEITPRWWEL